MISGNGSVQWIDAPVEIDRSFLDEVPLIPEKMHQSNVDPLMGSLVDRLFECNIPEPWAYFTPFPGYKSSVKRLFRNKVLATFDLDLAFQVLDKSENDEEAGKKLFEMFEELRNLNTILEEIYLRILSCLKP